MKGVVWLFFLVLVPFVSAGWGQYQGDLSNTGKIKGIGYFSSSVIVNITDFNDGSDFQPLVGDINFDNNNEIIIFSNDTLKIFDKTLDEIDSVKVGVLQGQPMLFNIDGDSAEEILFLSNVSSTVYFFAYEYNNSFIQEFNFTVPNGAIGSGVKCISLGNTQSCIFMDNAQYVHIVNMSSRNDQSYNTSVYTDTQEKIPAIGDIDNDGSLEAVFWFDANNNGDYGVMSFNLNNRSLDTDFNGVGWVDEIYSSFDPKRQILKGHPVLVDFNNDRKMEIAMSVFYDDSLSGNLNDWYTKIIVYGNNGSLLFRKCEYRSKLAPEDCSDGSSDASGIGSKWEGTNPFILDSNNDNLQDICFIKDKKGHNKFVNMTINCYNYSGSILLDSEISPSTGTVKSATVADMDNDGIADIITPNGIYASNGTLIFSADLGSNFVIPVDIDGNDGLDLIWSKTNQTTVFLDNTSYNFDLEMEEKGILFEKNSTQIIIHNNGNGFVNNAEVLALNTDTMENNTFFVNIRGNNNVTVDFNLTINEGENLLVQLDPDDEINEVDEKNNFAFRKFEGFPFVFVSVDLGIDNLEDEFIEYIKNNLKSSYYTDDENSADIKIYIGKNNPANKRKIPFTKNKFDYYYDFGNIYYKDKVGSFPYNGLVSAYKDENGIINILIYGNSIDGTIASVKEFASKEANFVDIEEDNSFFIDNDNIVGIKVFDFLHNTGNGNNYLLNNDAFRNIVRNALNDEMFVEQDYAVSSSSGVSLRLRNLKPNASSAYLSYLNSTGVPVELPVVLAHGLFSNLSTWQVLASEISNVGRDTWLIEITGGPGQDCDDCADYTFDDLISDYWPSLLNGVLTNTGKNDIQYVGFSNGCRTGLSSLEDNYFDVNKIETFIGVGCPGAFEGFDVGASGIKLLDNRINGNIGNRKHIGIAEMFVVGILGVNSVFLGEEKISVNLWEQYNTWINSSNDNQPGNIKLTNFAIIHGNAGGTSDGIVSITDEKSIYKNVNASKSKSRFNIFATHIDLDNRPATKNLVKKSINKEELSLLERNIYLKETNS